LHAARVELPLERLPHLDVAAEAHDEQQRRSFAPDGDSDELAVDADEIEQPVHHCVT
jgi:hypothetical protein